MCEFCQRPFSDKSNLNSHRRRKHAAAPVFGRGNPGKKNRFLGAKNWSKNYIRADLKNRPTAESKQSNQQNASPVMMSQSNEIDSSFVSSNTGISDIPSSSAFSLLKNDLPTMVNHKHSYIKLNLLQKQCNTKMLSIQAKNPMNNSEGQNMNISNDNYVHFDKDAVTNGGYVASNNLFLHRSLAGVGKYSPQNEMFVQRQEIDANSSFNQQTVSSSTETVSTSTQTDGKEQSSSASPCGTLHECKHCEVFFKDYVMYTVHMGCHAGDSPFKCNICQVDCTDAIQFACHFARGHSR